MTASFEFVFSTYNIRQEWFGYIRHRFIAVKQVNNILFLDSLTIFNSIDNTRPSSIMFIEIKINHFSHPE